MKRGIAKKEGKNNRRKLFMACVCLHRRMGIPLQSPHPVIPYTKYSHYVLHNNTNSSIHAMLLSSRKEAASREWVECRSRSTIRPLSVINKFQNFLHQRINLRQLYSIVGCDSKSINFY